MNLNDRILSLYDDYVATQPDGVKIAEIRDAIRNDVRGLLLAQERDVDREVEQLLVRVVGSERDRRSKSLRKQFEYLLDGINEDGAYIDPILNQAHRLGDAEGTDRLLRFWTSDNIRDVILIRYRIGSEALSAATEFDAWGTRLLTRMRLIGADSIGDAWSTNTSTPESSI